MKVLLTTLNSKYIHSNLALKYLYVAGMDQCPGLYLKEYTINNEDSYVFSELVQGAYNVICFSCYIWNIEKTRELASDAGDAAKGIGSAIANATFVDSAKELGVEEQEQEAAQAREIVATAETKKG